MYVNGMGFRAIERIKGVHHTSIINWVKQVGGLLQNDIFMSQMDGQFTQCLFQMETKLAAAWCAKPS